ncbi:MAG TPA: 50S ribosomal protein L23 [Candidatus Paceibacterota bacterium]|nr:50S ribosomal protein L23 [Candidatus Paceibacterota bacterium]HPT18293.1 50S ribosomal protein L23 [Candidatus Paceibacterota bacterium]
MTNAVKIIKNPRITEKASFNAEHNAYTFDVSKDANKTEIKKAIFSLYKVHPTRVNILKIQEKRVTSRGIKGVKSGGKKAVVYLKEGDKIEFI